MRFCSNYFILFIISFLLSACGNADNQTVTTPILSPLKVSKTASALTITKDQQYDIARLMQAMFNAAPGAINMNYLAGYLNNGASMMELATILAQTDSFQSPLLYPASLSSQEFATKFIDNLVGSTANYLNKALLADAVSYLLDHGLSRGETIWLVASALAKLPTTDSTWGRAAAQFVNKVEVAYYYSVTTNQAANDLGTLQAVTRNVTDDPATVIAAKATKPVNLAPSWASLGITSGNRQITLSWAKKSTSTSGTATYNIYWSKTPGVTIKNGTKIANVKSPYTHTGLANGTNYYYVVTEVAAGIQGTESQEVASSPTAVLPPKPAIVNLYPAETSVKVTIDRTGAGATTKFNLYWSTSPYLTNATKITNAFGSSTTFQHNGLKTGTMVYYAVSAETPDGESQLSNTMATIPLADIPATNYQKNISTAQLAIPKAINAVAASQQVTIFWDMPTNQIPMTYDPDATPTQVPVITAYNIYWSTAFISNTKSANKLTVPVTASASLPMSFMHNTGLTNNQPYYYVVTAVATTDANGLPLKTADGRTLTFESPPSGQIVIIPEAKQPVPPSGITATSGAQQILLSWTASSTSGAIYRVYVSDKMPAKPTDLVQPANLVTITMSPAYVHTGLLPGITYYYVVTAVTDLESPPTAVVSVALW